MGVLAGDRVESGNFFQVPVPGVGFEFLSTS